MLIEDWIKNKLPHGSGIDGDWNITKTADILSCRNHYRVMTAEGFYYGYADFTLDIYYESDNWAKSFRFSWDDAASLAIARRYGLCNYLDDLFYHTLPEIQQEWNYLNL